MKKKRWRRRFCVMVPLQTVLFVLVVLRIWRRMPTLKEYARLQATTALDTAIGDAVDIIQAEDVDSMLTFSQNESGQVQYVQLMDVEINRFSALVGKAIPGEIGKLQTVSVEVPLGALLGGRLLSGWGPKIRFPVSVNCTAVSNVDSDTFSTGINQTHLEIRLAVKATATVFFGGEVFEVSLSQTFIIADALIVGESPQIYAENNDLQRILGY